MALRGIEASYEAVRDWEPKLLPVMGDELHRRRRDMRRGSGASWYFNENYMLSEHRDMKAAKAFFHSARATMGFWPDRVTTDGHGSYPRAIRSVVGETVRHRTSAYLNNRLEQGHRGIKGRVRCMRGFKSHDAASRVSREHGELRNLLRPRRRHNQAVPASP